MDEAWKEAALTGNIDTMSRLIHDNTYVLEGVELKPFADTPLHIAARMGHIGFAVFILKLRPCFGRTLDRNLLTPIHLAIQNGHDELVASLLSIDTDSLSIIGINGLTPFLYAIQLGKLGILRTILSLCPPVILDVTVEKGTALHVAVKANEFEVLKMLVLWLERNLHQDAQRWEVQVINQTDCRGNTVLHTAVHVNDVRAMQLLFDCKSIKQRTKNHAGLTAADVLEDKIRLKEIAANWYPQSQPSVSNIKPILTGFFDKLATYVVRRRMSMSEGKCEAMLVVTSLILTIAFQGVLAPPSGLKDSNEAKVATYCMTITVVVMLVYCSVILVIPWGAMGCLLNGALLIMLLVYAVSVGHIYSPMIGAPLLMLAVPYALAALYFFLHKRASKLNQSF